MPGFRQYLQGFMPRSHVHQVEDEVNDFGQNSHNDRPSDVLFVINTFVSPWEISSMYRFAKRKNHANQKFQLWNFYVWIHRPVVRLKWSCSKIHQLGWIRKENMSNFGLFHHFWVIFQDWHFQDPPWCSSQIAYFISYVYAFLFQNAVCNCILQLLQRPRHQYDHRHWSPLPRVHILLAEDRFPRWCPRPWRRPGRCSQTHLVGE